MAKESINQRAQKATKKPVSVHLSDEEKAIFHEAMLQDHMVDLGPWIAKVVRQYIAEHDEYREQISDIERVVKDIQKRMATKEDVAPEGPQGGW